MVKTTPAAAHTEKQYPHDMSSLNQSLIPLILLRKYLKNPDFTMSSVRSSVKMIAAKNESIGQSF
jgi:hypothetical protein